MQAVEAGGEERTNATEISAVVDGSREPAVVSNADRSGAGGLAAEDFMQVQVAGARGHRGWQESR